MKSITKAEKAEIYQRFSALKIERPHLMILAASNNRTMFVDELTACEAEIVLQKLRNNTGEYLFDMLQSA